MVGNAIKKARVRAGYTKVQLGVLVGVSGNQIGRLEHGFTVHPPQPEMIVRLAQVLAEPKILKAYLEDNAVYQEFIKLAG